MVQIHDKKSVKFILVGRNDSKNKGPIDGQGLNLFGKANEK